MSRELTTVGDVRLELDSYPDSEYVRLIDSRTGQVSKIVGFFFCKTIDALVLTTEVLK